MKSLIIISLYFLPALPVATGQVNTDLNDTEVQVYYQDNAEMTNDSSTVYLYAEVMPQFPGGEDKLYEYLGRSILYPKAVLDNGVQGRVHVTFIVEVDGSISNVKVIRGIGGGCDEEAERVVKEMPPWQPGKKAGRAVRVQCHLPVSFKLKK